MSTAPHRIVDTTVPWRILLTAVPSATVDAAVLTSRLAGLLADQGWPGTPHLVAGADLDAMRRQLAAHHEAPIVVGLCGDAVVLSGDHAWLDGLGLFEVLGRLLDSPVASAARGVAGRAAATAALPRRLLEVALAPPAALALVPVQPAAGDVLVQHVVEARVRTADLVWATSAACSAYNAVHGRRTRHIAIAVGAARREPAAGVIADRSELLRLRDVERLSREQVALAVRTAPRQPPLQVGGTSARLAGTALRVLAPRLGSTCLVSHLGEVSAPGVRELAFHPVSVGGTGLSLGALGLHGATVLTLRARGHQWDVPTLTRLLDLVVASLDG